jgi:hypothetical protein
MALDLHEQQLEALKSLLDEEQGQLLEAQENLTAALKADEPAKSSKTRHTAWQQAKDSAKTAFKDASDNFNDARKRLEEFANPSPKPAKKFTKLPARQAVTPFAPSLKTTQRDVDDFFANYERVMQNHNLPEEEHGKHRFFDCITVALEKGLKTFGLETDLLEWVDEQQQHQDWQSFKKAFATKFVRDKTYSAAKTRYAECRQGSKTVSEFFVDFKKCAKRASFTQEPPANWSTTMSNFADTFMQRIQTKLMYRIMNHPRFSTDVATNLEELAKLAAECEQLLVLEKATVANARDGKWRSQDKGGRKPSDNKLPQRQNNKPRPSCPRCGRTHAGGRAACTAKWHKDGTMCDDLRRCAKCASPAHTTATCPKKATYNKNGDKRNNAGGKDLRVKFARTTGKKRKHAGSRADEEGEPSNSDESDNEDGRRANY